MRAALAAADVRVQRLAITPEVGPITAPAFVATPDDIGRFRDAHQVMAYPGLVPSERNSGERRHRGRITKAGSPRVRWLLVEAAWRILRSRDSDAAPLQAWAAPVALRRGKRVAVWRSLAGWLGCSTCLARRGGLLRRARADAGGGPPPELRGTTHGELTPGGD